MGELDGAVQVLPERREPTVNELVCSLFVSGEIRFRWHMSDVMLQRSVVKERSRLFASKQQGRRNAGASVFLGCERLLEEGYIRVGSISQQTLVNKLYEHLSFQEKLKEFSRIRRLFRQELFRLELVELLALDEEVPRFQWNLHM